MTTFEYKVLVLPASNYDVDEEILGLHGEKGWELVTVLLDRSNYRVAYFKRPVLDAPAPDLEETSSSLTGNASR
jgi:hypothetical protein